MELLRLPRSAMAYMVGRVLPGTRESRQLVREFDSGLFMDAYGKLDYYQLLHTR